ncbi:MAG: hypothetical protein ABSG31_08315 [Tepidisphaeraceae bacterium]
MSRVGLEYDKALPPRIPLAGPATIAAAFSMGRGRESFAPAAAGCEGVSRSGATSTVQCSPACPTCPGVLQGTLLLLF